MSKLLFPSEFDFDDQYKKYNHMGNDKYKAKDGDGYCKDYATWLNNFKAAYHSINSKDDRLQLKWAFREKYNIQKNEKEIDISILLAILLAFVSCIPSLIYEDVAQTLDKTSAIAVTFYVIAFIIVIVEVIILFQFFNSTRKLSFIKEANRILDSIDDPE